MRYCIVVTITSADTANQIRNLFGLQAGGTGLKDYVLGRDLDPDSNTFGRWVLAFGGVAVTSGTDPKTGLPLEVDVVALVAYNADISDLVKTRIGDLANNRPSLVRQLQFDPPVTRLQMQDRLAVEVGQEMSADHYWHAKPGDDVTTGVNSAATLLAKFQVVPGV